MAGNDLELMSVSELWDLHEQILRKLREKIAAKQAKLDERLRRIGVAGERHPYRPVLPKYQNPNDPRQTWSGRGRHPYWHGSASRRQEAGRFLIDRTSMQLHRQSG
jgi:DNA-binding protein H-NS